VQRALSPEYGGIPAALFGFRRDIRGFALADCAGDARAGTRNACERLAPGPEADVSQITKKGFTVRNLVDISSKNRRSGNSTDPALLVVGHGSRDARGAREFRELVALMRERNPGLPIEGGFIELSRPPISECVSSLAAGGFRRIAAVPLMLLAAGHAKDDIPATLVREKMNHPEVTFGYGRALGLRPELLSLMEERISATVPEDEKEETAVLVVGRGSSDPDANSDLAKVSRLFYEGRSCPMVETAYVSMTPPNVFEGLERLKRLGAKKVAVFSYFLFTGVLEERIREQSEEFAARSPELSVSYAGYFGPHEKVADLVLDRYREAVEGDIRMNCDVCVHRVALPGFEEKVGATATPHYHPDEPGHSHGHHHH
jgi:sirohydrochlorin cobaltochelatase